jgi:hypothetical protein
MGKKKEAGARLETMETKRLAWEKRLFSLLVFVVLISAVVASIPWDLRASLIVFVLGGAGVLLALIQVVSEFRSVRAPKEPAAGFTFDTPRIEATGRWGNLEIWAWIFGFFVAIHLVGFLVAVPLFVLAYGRVYGAGWPTSLGLAFVCWGFVYGLFERVLHAPWPHAILFSFF